MKFLIDAQLPFILCDILKEKNIEAVHVDSLPNGDETLDSEITAYADQNNYTVVTKDSDFYHSHILYRKPAKIFLVQTGNIKNRDLFDLFRHNMKTIKKLGDECTYLEINEDGVYGH